MLNREGLRPFLPLGILRDTHTWVPVGAGTLFSPTPPVCWFVTAAHVIHDNPNRHFVVLVNRKDGPPAPVDLTGFQHLTGTAWQSDTEHDVAATLMPYLPDFDVCAVGRDDCLAAKDIAPSMQCFTVGCPYTVRAFNPREATPLALDGIIAGVLDKTKQLWITAPTFPGNSGGPLIVVRPLAPSGRLVQGPWLRFAGVVTHYLLVSDPDPRPGGPLPPLHLGVAASADHVLMLLESAGAKEQVEIARRAAS